MILNKRNMTTRIWRMKDGVSLFTVLMFMLVATIAATATYKWITTESSSSTDRMIQREAYQSALAGIESARGWMTYNANETGALIKQYKDGNNAPIKLNDRLAAFVRAGQSYDVYLVGVSASPENPTYKLKLVSVGYARDKRVKHSEVAILNVNGLYQVRLPVHTSSDTSDFQYAYFGGTVTYEGSSVVTSMVVNGDWDKNPPKTTEGDFVVTGNATLSGNDIYVQKTACIGGKLESNNGFIAQNFLGMGPVKDLNPIIYNNAYFAGTFNMGQSCNAPDNSKGFYVGGNMTVAGTFNFDKCGTGNIGEGTPRTVAGNTCVIGNGQIKTDGNLVALKGSAWMESDYPIWRDDNDNYDDYNRFVIGTDANSNIYIKSGHPWSDYDGTLRAKKFKQVKNAPGENGFRSCKDGSYVASWGGGWWLCEPADDGWDNAEYQPYPARNNKDNLYYLYHMTPGTTDIDFGSFTEDKWHKCNPFPMGCMPGDFVKLNAYFINFTAKEKKYIFTSSTHSQDDNHTVKVGENYYRYLNHDGSSITGSPFCHLNSGKTWQPICGVKPWFRVDGQFKTWSDNQPAEVECAESVKAHCDSIWEYTPGAGCEGKDGTKANYTVRDQVVTGYNVFKTFANRPKCAKDIIGLDDNAMTNYDVEVGSKSLKDCYDSAAKHDKNEPDATKKHLYNGYLVIELDNAKLLKNASGKLDGKFIIIINHNEGRDIKLPATKDADDYLFLYLKEGLNNIDMTGANNNTFIYSDGDINEFHGNNHTLSGSVYAKAANCARVKKMWTSDLVFNPPLVNDLATNGVICDASTSNESTCGGVNQDDPASSSGYDDGPIGEGGYDPYYIGVAPQLSVTVESQYKNKETVNVEQSPEVKASFIVLPRIVYLTKDAKGKLSNYYNIVPLNTTKGVTGTSVSCNGIPTSGKLTDGGELEEGAYTCTVSGSVTATAVGTGNTSTTQMRVPFWVVVKGEGGTLPLASFADQTKEVNIGASTVASLVLPSTTGALQSCNVKFTVSEHGTDWVVEPTANATPGDAGVYTAVVTSEAAVPVLNVKNISSEDGSVILTVTAESEGCNPGSPEVIYNANTATIKRYSIETYCNGEGSSDDKCSSGGEYDRAKNRPDCVTSEEWVTVQGNSCSVSSTNQTWSCAISGNISLKAVGSVDGCETIVSHLSHPAPLTVGEEYKLYASLKALPMTFHTGFETSKDIPEDTKIKIEVSDESGTRNSVCSYSNFKNEETRATYCDVLVYRNSTVTLTLGTEPDPKDFNYWKCEGGPDCFSDEPFTGNSYEITITGDGNTVYAHFGEQDKHCFFDEFKDARESGGTVKLNRGTVQCEENSTNYCIDYCENDGNKCPTNQVTSSFPNAKWRLVERSTASWEDIDYSSADARIALKSSATRGKKESEKKQAIIMSSVQAGLYGTLKALFQPPHEGVSAGDEARATVRKSGFILRSTPDVSSYLMLNVFIASDGVLKARLCVNGGSSCSEDVMLKNKDGSSYSPEQNHLVTLSATIEQKDGESYDMLTVKVYSSAWAKEPYSAEIKLSDGEISGVTNTGDLPNEYVGYALSDQNFKIYGIGWRSETYNSTCWDTYPTISCSFKAAYPAGIVPLNTASKPWVGFSAWFDEFDGGCDEKYVSYYYRGSDACGGTNSKWEKCSDATNPYTFSETGAHGYYDGDNAVRMAMVSVLPENCTIYGSEANWIGGSTATDCGSFWVGEQNACSRHYVFESTVSGDEGDYFGLADGTANVRGANLYVTLDNPNGNTVEVYLFSKNEADRYTYYGNKEFIYSLPYQSSMTGEDIRIEIPVKNISNAEGFDPEHVQGVYVKTFNEPSVNIKKVESSCPNAVEITGCSATYSGGKWNIVAEIKNKSHTDTIEVEETHSYISDPSSLACYYDSNSPACEFDGDNAKFDWTDNPYAGHAGTEYEFRISLTSKENTTSECTTTGSVTGIEAKCGSVSQNTILQGKGLPQFTYGISNCPDETSCNYKIELVKDGSAIMTITSSTSSGNVNTMTATNAANGSEILAEGTYKFRLSSTNAARPFTGCESDVFAVEEPGVITASPCSFNSIVKGTSTATLTMSNIANVVENTNITIHSGSHTITKTLSSEATSATFSDVPAPSDANTYTYTIDYTVNGNTKTICSATLNVLDGLGCSVSTGAITVGESFTFTPTYGGTCYSGSLTDNGNHVGNGCSDFNLNPTTVGTHTYVYTFSGSIGNDACEQTVTVNPPAPEVKCPTDAINVEPGTNISFTPTLLTGCSAGCEYWVENSSGTKMTPSPNGTMTSPSSVSFTGEALPATGNPYSYTLRVSNSTSKSSCSVPVYYQKPTYGCPRSTEKTVGATVSVTPTNVTYCAQGCDYKVTKGSASGTAVIGPGTGYNSGALGSGFTGESTAQTVTYYVTLSNPAGDGTACDFDVTYKTAPTGCTCIAWVNGTGDYYKNCYSSGLKNMNGKCYTLNPERKAENPQWINDDANESHWWSVVSCTEWTGCSGGGSGGGGDEGINWTNNTTLEAGTHTIAKCNSNTGTKTTQITASFANCWDAFSATTGAGYWNNVTGNCNGYASVTYPVTVTVPSGGTLTLSNCY